MRWHESSILISLKMILTRNPEFDAEDQEERQRWDDEDEKELKREEERR